MGEAKRKLEKRKEMLLSCAGVQTMAGKVQMRWETESAATPMGQLAYFNLMAGLRLVLGVEVHAGNEHSSKHGQPGLLKILDALPLEKKPKLVRGDNG